MENQLSLEELHTMMGKMTFNYELQIKRMGEHIKMLEMRLKDQENPSPDLRPV